ncbi:hypothetical protein ACIG5E_38545 [Kitasatospora sp. NPDC053057]|uniref:hypothetical protein n=1 Tax=Kitasatospora sp. NPDC053057 TaxID=3364062 RepID=UPI0037C9F1C3
MSAGSYPPNDRSARYEIREITSRSPHFRLLECWGVWDRQLSDYVRRANDTRDVRRFYTAHSAETFMRNLEGLSASA